MHLQLQNVGKHYQYQWIFRNVDLDISSGEKIAIKGHNGSGKSTLLKICCGLESLDEGQIMANGKPTSINPIHQKAFSFTAPYTHPIMDFSTSENIGFAAQFKPWRMGLSNLAVARLLPTHKRNFDKPLHLLSSGMIQRVKILLCMLADVPLVCLDEPLSNLDTEGMEWYKNLGETYLQAATVLVAGNNKHEFSFCDRAIDLAERSQTTTS